MTKVKTATRNDCNIEYIYYDGSSDCANDIADWCGGGYDEEERVLFFWDKSVKAEVEIITGDYLVKQTLIRSHGIESDFSIFTSYDFEDNFNVLA